MTQERITQTDLRRALEHHVEVLAIAGITYAGRLELQTGSKVNGIAYRLYRTGYLVPEGNGYRPTTGHGRPPIGSDYLGMTAREAYESLTDRTSVIAETAHEIAAAR